MTVRIDTAPERSKTIVSVSGRLEGAGVEELMRACHLIEGEFVLDLTGVRSADPGGIDAIRELTSRLKFLSAERKFPALFQRVR